MALFLWCIAFFLCILGFILWYIMSSKFKQESQENYVVQNVDNYEHFLFSESGKLAIQIFNDTVMFQENNGLG